jgi:hypothetical protein
MSGNTPRDLRTCIVLAVSGFGPGQPPVYWVMRGPLRSGRRHAPWFDAHQATVFASFDREGTSWPDEVWYARMAGAYATPDFPAVPWQGGPPPGRKA